MVGTNLRQDLLNFINSMKEQGILDHQFDNIRSLQTPEYPHFISEMITAYFNDADVAMATVARLLNDEVVNFNILIVNVERLKDSSASIGGCKMALVCRELQQACEQRKKDRCLAIFTRVQVEYQTLHDNLVHIQQMENSIVWYESRRRG